MIINKRYLQFIPMLAVLAVVGCSDNKAYETSICVLADVSGTYAKEKDSMVKIIKAGVIPKLNPGDGMFLIAIDSNSYTQDNLISKMTLDYRPTESQKQKLAFSKSLDKFAESDRQSTHTDISGAMMLCSDYLKDTKSGTQIIFVFSDMKEELPPGLKRKFDADEFVGINIAAMNVIKLGKDSANPQVYRERMDHWEDLFKKAGAKSWNNLLDPKKFSEFYDSIKS